MIKYIVLIIIIFISGCASETAKMAHQIKHNPKDKFNDTNNMYCRSMIDKSENEDFIFNARLIATPIIGIIGIVAAPAILAANASLDLKDRLTASQLSKACGGKGIKAEKIFGDIAVNGSLGIILQGSNLSIYPGGEEIPVSTAAEAATN